MTLRLRLILMGSGIAISTTLLVAITIAQLTISNMQDESRRQHENSLVAKRELISVEVGGYFSTIRRQIVTMAQDQSTIAEAMDYIEAFAAYPDDVTDLEPATVNARVVDYYTNDFKQAFDTLNPEGMDINALFSSTSSAAKQLQYEYIANNPYPLGEKDGLATLDNGSRYAEVHARFHPSKRRFLKQFGYYDVFIVEAQQGHIVYSVFKELDFATSLKSGPYRDSGIAEAFSEALTLSPGETYLTDFAAYTPSYGQPASFIASPIHANGEVIAVLIYQMPIDRLNDIMTQSGKWQDTGFGDSGEIYLVGPDQTLRNESRFFVEDRSQYLAAISRAGISERGEIETRGTSISLQPVHSPGARQALRGQSGVAVFPDYRQVPVLSAFAPVQIGSMTWGILSEIDVAEVNAATDALAGVIFKLTLGLVLVVSVIAVAVAVFLAGRLISPLNELTERLTSMSQGDADLSRRITMHSAPEINRIADAFNEFAAMRHNVIGGIKDSTHEVASTATELYTTTLQSSDNIHSQFEEIQNIGKSLNHFVTVLEDVTRQTQSVHESTGHAQESTKTNADRALLASGNIQQLVDEVTHSSSSLENLQEQVAGINDVLGVIHSIADQTNLLALNAAIEAARAGEHGRGFAVVADEVRTLAFRTQESTVTISDQINQLAKAAGDSVESMQRASISAKGGIHLVEGVSDTLTELKELVGSIAATNKSVAAASQAQNRTIETINANISELRGRASRLSDSATEVTSAAQGLSLVAEKLSAEVDRFKT